MDLNVMMREQALNGLNTQLDTAVTNGDTEAARKITKQIADLTAATAPAKPAYGHSEVAAAIEAKADWFGVDPKKTATALQFGKDLNPKRFATAEAFAEAVIKAVEAEFRPATAAKTEEDDGEGDPEGEEGEDEGESKATKKAAARRTDAPGEGDALNNRAGSSRRTGPWTKLSEAPADVAKEINRSAAKFLPANVTKEQRETYVSRALERHYDIHQRNKGKK